MLMQVYMAYIKRFAKDEEMNLDDSLAEIKVPPLPLGVIPAGKYGYVKKNPALKVILILATCNI